MLRRKEALGLAALAAVVLAAVLPYASSLSFAFTFDDTFTIVGHQGVHRRPSVDDLLLRDFWGRSFMDTIGSWRPVTTFTYWVDWHAAGGQPWLFHATNLALYAILLVAAERFLHRFFDDALARPTRLLATGVFGALAIHADVVPSATGRSEILAALFALLALTLPLRTGGVRLRDAIASAGATLLAMGSKESALPIAILVPVLAYRWHSSRGTARKEGHVALAATNAAVLVGVIGFRVLRMPWWALGPRQAAENALVVADVPVRLLGAAAVFAHYLGHLVWPSRLAPDYSYAALDVTHEPLLAAAGSALALALALAVALAATGRHRQAPGFPDAALGLGASYVVVSQVIVPASNAMADRLFFFPSLWVIACAALVAERAPHPYRRVIAIVSVAFAAGQGLVAARDALAWRDDLTLLSSAVEARPSVARSRRNLAEALAEAGRPEDAAWQLVVSMAILERFPAPVPADTFPPDIDGQPIAVRLDALGGKLGACVLRARMKEARAAFQHWGDGDEVGVLERWLATARACADD